MSTSKRYHHGDLRNALVQAGKTILAQEGNAGLDLRKVARVAGVSHAAPYRHFADKQALLAAIAEDGFEQLVERMDTELHGATEQARDQLEHLARAYVGFAVDNPSHMREMFSGLSIERMKYPALYDAGKAAFSRLIDAIVRGQENGEIGADDPTDLALVIWSQIHGLAMLLIEDQVPGVKGDPHAVVALIASSMHALYDGLHRRAPN